MVTAGRGEHWEELNNVNYREAWARSQAWEEGKRGRAFAESLQSTSHDTKSCIMGRSRVSGMETRFGGTH